VSQPSQHRVQPAQLLDRVRISIMFFGGGRRVRTDDIQLAKLALSQLSYTPMDLFTPSLASPEGFEPPTHRVEAGCSESTELRRDKRCSGRSLVCGQVLSAACLAVLPKGDYVPHLSHCIVLERPPRVELGTGPWQGSVLPLNYGRIVAGIAPAPTWIYPASVRGSDQAASLWPKACLSLSAA
jgi:hypothetical protein